jgi:lysozyme
VTEAGLAIIRHYERFEPVCYLCPAGVPTWGYGDTEGLTMADVGVKRTTMPEAERRLQAQVAKRERIVRAMLTRPATDNQVSAMVCLGYNIGNEALRSSSVVRFHNAGDTLRAANAFRLWNKARDPRTGVLKVLNGLVARREKERELYLTP